MILDKSGSMQSVKEVTISGLNEQLQSIKTSQEEYNDQEQIACFVTFNDNVECETLWNSQISDVKEFTTNTYKPNGSTALLDAVGIGINKLRNEIQSELNERKANVIVTIFTDGWENASKEYNHSQIKELVDEIQETGLWTVAFLGCGSDVFEVAQNLGISRGNTMRYQTGEAGTQEAFTSMATARSLRSQAYSDNISKGLDTSHVNLEANFFKNMDISEENKEEEEEEEENRATV